jgi:hypothetical protein
MLINPHRFGLQSTLLAIIGNLGLSSGLKCCLDAGDLNSYDGTSQTWVDASGNGNSFYRGTTSGSDATDPTFNGVAGALADTAYFSTDGGDSFTEAADLSFADTWGADGTKFTLVGLIYLPSNPAATATLFGNGTSSNVLFEVKTNGRISLNCPEDFTLDSSNSLSLNAWNFVAASMDENGGASGTLVRVQSTQTTGNGARTAPDAATGAYKIGTTSTGANGLFPSGTRFSMFAAWNGVALTNTQLSDLYTAIKTLRHTTLP